ncbi:hypothetical protein [Cellulomonas humilata]|uniref:hypothetical protein n=1 Tax=Cellulomonas humilata TaxID=144055 RepID=UPI0027D8C4FD|nr:hypothetical protein [Cellulomonas humilata]
MPHDSSARPQLPPGWPDRLFANAWTGSGTADGAPDGRAPVWAVTDHFRGRPTAVLAAQKLADLGRHKDPRVGWALVLPDSPDVPPTERHRADDAPVAAQRLAGARTQSGEPLVVRYAAGNVDELYRYLPDGTRTPLPTTGDGPRGVGAGALPYYLLLLGGPEVIPWELQFRLNHVAFTGRLDLDEEGLGHYVDAALTEWADSETDATSPLLWTAELGRGDITALMRTEVGERTLARWRDDTQIGDRAVDLRGAQATRALLAQTLADRHPGVVVTTSHGATGPLEDAATMRATLGWLVDSEGSLLDPHSLVQLWEPDGVVWYGLACCSAGGSGTNQFTDVLDPASDAGKVFDAVAALGAVTADLPRALLGAPKPARAFIGHVEPTFDWTLRRPVTGISTTDSLVEALYDGLFQASPLPVGLAFRRYFLGAASLRSRWASERGQVEESPAARTAAFLAALTGMDRQCTVILGDPAVVPAALPAE